MRSSALLSHCKTYRYALWRIWDESLPICNFIMLNPSTADETVDDPTIRRCIGYAKAWNYGGVVVSNLFALRSTDPSELKSAADPVGPENDLALRTCFQESAICVCAWGNHGGLYRRSMEVCAILGSNLYCLRVTKKGEPVHPLYQKGDLKPVEFKR